MKKYLTARPIVSLFVCFLSGSIHLSAQTITHQVPLPPGMNWCGDGAINSLLSSINDFRTSNGAAPLTADSLGSKDAEIRAIQVATYMATNPPGSPGFSPHQGYDTTASGLGYDLISENLAYYTTSPSYIVYGIWQDPLHLAAMLSRQATVAGVSCVISDFSPYWTYEPGVGHGSTTLPPPPPPVNTPPPSGGPVTLDSEETAFVSLLNAYRSQNGVGPVQISPTLESASKWMSNDMATKNYASHTDTLVRDPGARLQAFGYTYYPWGENIAGGFSDASTTLNQWIGACDADASGNCTFAHRKNMLNPAFQAIGIARAYSASSNYGWYWTNDFGGVLDQASTAAAPVISYLKTSASPISPGQTATLSWSVSGASSVTIDNGVGNVSGITSQIVAPAATTTYRLTATNSTGATSATVTVAVNTAGPVPDTQAPTAPSLTSATAKGSTEVDLAWTAATDNVAVAGYQITRNGTAVTSLPGSALMWADTAVAAGVTYTYSVKAFDAAGNYSSPGNTLQVVTAPAAPPVGVASCASPGTGLFTGCYYSNINLTGTPVLINSAAQLVFDWTWGFPAVPVPQSNFSVRWQGNFPFAGGTYTFKVVTGDGVRVYIDGAKILDSWQDQPGYSFNIGQTLSAGNHLITVEYYDHTALPVLHVTWQ